MSITLKNLMDYLRSYIDLDALRSRDDVWVWTLEGTLEILRKLKRLRPLLRDASETPNEAEIVKLVIEMTNEAALLSYALRLFRKEEIGWSEVLDLVKATFADMDNWRPDDFQTNAFVFEPRSTSLPSAWSDVLKAEPYLDDDVADDCPDDVGIARSEIAAVDVETAATRELSDFRCGCKFCGLKFKRRLELRRHQRKEHGQEDLKLSMATEEICPKIVVVDESKTDGSDFANACPYCGKIFQRASYIEDHVRRVHKKIDSAHPCDLCGGIYASRQGLLLHKETMHQIPRPRKKISNEKVGENSNADAFRCCGKVFKHRMSYNSHVNRLHNDDPPEYYRNSRVVCPHCGVERSGKYSLRKHIESVHENKKRSKCHICGKEFSMKRSAQEHVDSVHMKLKKHPCQICGVGFTTSRNRDAHVKLVHLNVRSHPCTVCGRAFSRRKQLDVHVKNAHREAELGISSAVGHEEIDAEESISLSSTASLKMAASPLLPSLPVSTSTMAPIVARALSMAGPSMVSLPVMSSTPISSNIVVMPASDLSSVSIAESTIVVASQLELS